MSVAKRTIKKDFDIVGQIYQTKDYEAFEFLPWNRQIDVRHVEELINSIKINGWYRNPIAVQKTDIGYAIINGQHRYHALKELGLPIELYLVENAVDLAKMVIIFNSKHLAWGFKDYVTFFMEMGKLDYKILYTCMEKYPDIKYPTVYMRLCSGRIGTAFLEVKHGMFKARSMEDIEKEVVALLKIKEVLSIRHRYAWPNTKILSICLTMLKQPRFKLERLLYQIERYPDLFYISNTYKKCREMMQELYIYIIHQRKIGLIYF